MVVDQQFAAVPVAADGRSGQVQLRDRRQRQRGQVGIGIERLVAAGDHQVAQVQEQAAAGAPDHLGDESGLVVVGALPGQVAGRVLQQQAPTQAPGPVDVAADPIQGLGVVAQGQEVGQVAVAMAGPGQVLGHQQRRMPAQQPSQGVQVRGIEGMFAADRQTHAMDGQALRARIRSSAACNGALGVNQFSAWISTRAGGCGSSWIARRWRSPRPMPVSGGLAFPVSSRGRPLPAGWMLAAAITVSRPAVA